jgi:tRNA pseudouridine55 synthase
MIYTTLINKDNKIKDSYYKHLKLVEAYNYEKELIKVEEETYKHYLELKKYLEKKNISIELDSCYRGIDEQQKILDERVDKSYVALPYYSEHHSGLAIDLAIYDEGEYHYDNEYFALKEDLVNEITSVLDKFGFILRYPFGKEEIMGYPYEAWHIRYVGVVPATIIYKNKWTLEEYLEYFSGILVVNKPSGMTSREVVNDISHLFGIKKIGHTGTLDPMATGVLVITMGKATKVSNLITSLDKEYVAGVLLGIKTDTLDITGKVVDSKLIPNDLDIESCLKSFKKTYLQEVPIYSAVKIKGKKLYQYARNNKEIELPKRSVTIKEIKLLSTDNDTFKFSCLVTKGCYIRSLINDIGLSLNTYATMSSLERTKQGKFKIEDSYSLEDIKNNKYKLLSIIDTLDYKKIIVDDSLLNKVNNGVELDNIYKVNDIVLFLNKKKELLAIYKVCDNKLRCMIGGFNNGY